MRVGRGSGGEEGRRKRVVVRGEARRGQARVEEREKRSERMKK